MRFAPLLLMAASLGLTQPCQASAPFPTMAGPIFFPDTPDGEKILPIDFHVHTIFSDGWVWPTVRVDEASAEGLSAIALTDHDARLEAGYELAGKNGLVDLNRSHAVAAAYAKGKVQIIRAIEITRSTGHYNCFYTSDNNAIRVVRHRPASPGQYVEDSEDPERNALAVAKKQDAFCIWNHPGRGGEPQPLETLTLNAVQDGLISSGLVNGIEVANAGIIYHAALDLALSRDLTLIGGSDTHNPITTELSGLGMPHRTLTLVMAKDGSPTAIRHALEARKTVVLYRNTLIGSRDNLVGVLTSALRYTTTSNSRDKATVTLEIENRSSVPMTIELGKALKTVDRPQRLTIPASGTESVTLFARPLSELGLRMRVLNTISQDADPVEITLAAQQ